MAAKISAILLAAGLSSRMEGPNKLLLGLKGKPIITTTYEQLASSNVDEIIVVTGRDQKEVETILHLRPQDCFVHNPAFVSGMTSSIQAGAKVASGDAFMICLGDMPFIKTEAYQWLLNHSQSVLRENEAGIVFPMLEGKRCNPVVFAKKYSTEIMNCKEPNGCKSVILNNGSDTYPFATEFKGFAQDIDTEAQYRKAAALNREQ